MLFPKKNDDEKSEKTKRSRIFWLIFIWSILFHIFLFLVFLFFGFKKHRMMLGLKKQPVFVLLDERFSDNKKKELIQKKIEEIKRKEALLQGKKIEEKKKEENDLPASLKPRKSVFGATYIEHDMAEFAPPESMLVGSQDMAGVNMLAGKKVEGEGKQEPFAEKLKQELEVKKEAEYIEKKVEKIEAKKEVLKTEKAIEAKKELKAEESKPKVEDVGKKFAEKKEQEELVAKVAIEGQKAQEAKLEQKAEELKIEKRAEQVKERIEQKIKEIERRQQLVAQKDGQQSGPNIPESKVQKIKNFGMAEQDRSPIQMPKRSIIAMTKGYVENLKDEGSDWIERKGDDSKRPSFEELKYISYEEKINWHLQHSWKQNFAYRPYSKILEGKIVVGFKIDEFGNIKDISVLQSSGENELDRMIVKSIEFASPLPPIPKHFGVTVYETGRMIHVTSNKFGI